MTIAIAKEAFNRKISLLTSKLNIELKKKLIRCYVWSRSIWRALKCGAGGEWRR
jgi:hypothetical protein